MIRFYFQTPLTPLPWHYQQGQRTMSVWKKMKFDISVTLPGGCTVSGTGNLTIGIPAALTLNECDIRIVAKDSQNKETSKIPRTGIQSLTLSVESLDGTPLTGYSYAWTHAISTSAGTTSTAAGTTPTISATTIGEYKVAISGAGNRTCVAYLTVSKGLCQTVSQTYQCGTRPATPVGTPGSPPLTNLAPGDTIRTGDFDVVVTEVTGGGAGGWQGKGYTEIPYLKNQRIAVELNSAVVNDCYELMSGTVVSAYDPDWGGVRSVNAAIDLIEDLTTRLVDLYNTYTGTQGEIDKIREINTQLCQGIANNNTLSAEQKAQLLAECQAYNTDSEAFFACTAPGPTTNAAGNRASARVATTAGSCTVTAEDMAKRSENLGAKAGTNATTQPPKEKPNDYFSASGQLKRPMTFYSVEQKKVVELGANDKLNIRPFGADFFQRHGNEILFFTQGAKNYYAHPYKSGVDTKEYIEEKDKNFYPLTPVTAPLPEVFTVKYTQEDQGGCVMEVFKTALKADGTLDGPKVSVWTANSDCGATDEFLAEYGKGLSKVLAGNGQQADIYLYDCSKPNQYVHVTATSSQTLTGAVATAKPGTANVMLWACWNKDTKSWGDVKTEFRRTPALNPKFNGKGVSPEAVNDLVNKKAKKLLQQPDAAKHVSSTAGTNTNFNGSIADPTKEGRFEYKNSNIFAFIVGLKDISGKLIELAKVPEYTWNPADQDYEKSVVKVPAVLAGGADQTLEEFTEGLQFVNLALEIAAEPAKAKQIWDGIRNISPETVKNMIKEHAAVYAGRGPKAWYQGGRDGITIAFMWKGLVGAATKIAGYASQLGTVTDQVQQAGATIAGLITGTSKVADEVLGLLKKLQSKFSSEQTFMAFLQDFGSDESLDILRRFDAPSTDPNALDIKLWEMLQAKDRKFVRKSATHLAKFQKLTSDVQKLVIEFSDSKTNSTLAEFLDDLDDVPFLQYVNDPANEKFVRGFVNHKLSIADQQDIGGLLADVGKAGDIHPKVQEWLEYSQGASSFKRYRELGVSLGKNIATALADKRSPLYQVLKAKAGISNLDDYVVFTEVPLKTSGGFMKADVMLVRRNIRGEVDDVVLVENKLSKGTAYTDRQREGFGQIGQAPNTTMTVEYGVTNSDGISLAADVSIPITRSKCFKISDHGNTDNVGFLNASDVEFVDFSKIK